MRKFVIFVVLVLFALFLFGCTEKCGNDKCETLEKQNDSCPKDCTVVISPDSCGNGVCDSNETVSSCTSDCNVSKVNVDQIIRTCVQPCVAGGTVFVDCAKKCNLPKNLTDDGQSECGDGVCNSTEQAHSNLCPRDCNISLAGTNYSCSQGTYNSSTKKCEVIPNVDYLCALGVYDSTLNKCVYSPEVVGVCSSGVLDFNSGNCLVSPSVYFSCDLGTYNSDLDKCVVEPEVSIICSQGAYNELTKQCEVFVNDVSCEKGSYDSAKKVCVYDPSKLTCAENGGNVCLTNQTCLDVWISSTNSNLCCLGNCQTQIKTCAQQSGNICTTNQTCSGNLITASDSTICCDAICVDVNVQSVNSCGDGDCNSIERANPTSCPIDCSVRTFSDLAYGSDSMLQKLDLYLPADISKKVPLIITIHGGGFENGDKYPAPYDKNFLAHGYAVASINYRLSSRTTSSPKYPAANNDVKSAVRWLRANAEKFNLDSNHFGALGQSAGGYLVSFLGTTGETTIWDVGDNLQYLSSVQAVIDQYGLVNLPKLRSDKIASGYDVSPTEEKDVYFNCILSASTCTPATVANPLSNVSSNDSPFLIIHGAVDDQVSVRQSIDFNTALNAAGVKATFIKIDGAKHGVPASKFDAYIPQYISFFDTYLK